MTSAEFEILTYLDSWGPSTATELRDGITPDNPFDEPTWQTYAARLRALNRRGFVTKGGDPASAIWDLTTKARKWLAE